jgi:hypothetical protein
VAYQGMVYGMFFDKIHVELCIYYRKYEDTKEVACVIWEEAHLAHKVVLDLAVDVQRKGHVNSMDNFFTSVGLFEELALRQIYATKIV